MTQSIFIATIVIGELADTLRGLSKKVIAIVAVAFLFTFYRKEIVMKRANGSGSVYKRKDARRRNPFVAVINLGFDNKGQRKKKIIGLSLIHI